MFIIEKNKISIETQDKIQALLDECNAPYEEYIYGAYAKACIHTSIKSNDYPFSFIDRHAEQVGKSVYKLVECGIVDDEDFNRQVSEEVGELMVAHFISENGEINDLNMLLRDIYAQNIYPDMEGSYVNSYTCGDFTVTQGKDGNILCCIRHNYGEINIPLLRELGGEI